MVAQYQIKVRSRSRSR